MDKKNDLLVVPTGTVLLVSIFTILLIVMFTVLTISSVSSDEVLMQKTVEGINGYYEADGKAEIILSKLDVLYDNGENVNFESEISNLGCDIVNSNSDGSVLVEYSVPISELKELVVNVNFKANSSFEKICWKVVTIID